MDHPLHLPNEIFVKILQYLDIKSLLNGTLVCKKWKDTIRNDNITGGCLTLCYESSKGKRLMTEKAMEILSLWPELRELTLKLSGPGLLAYNLRNWKAWQHLKFDMCPNVKTIKLCDGEFDDRLIQREIPVGLLISKLEVSPKFFEDFDPVEIIGMNLTLLNPFNLEQHQIFFQQFHEFYPNLKQMNLSVWFHYLVEDLFPGGLTPVQNFLERIFDSKCIKENVDMSMFTVQMSLNLEDKSIEDLIKLKKISTLLVQRVRASNIYLEFYVPGMKFAISSKTLKIFMLKDGLPKYRSAHTLCLVQSISILTEGFATKDVYLTEIDFKLMDVEIFSMLKSTKFNALYFIDCINTGAKIFTNVWKLLKCPRSLNIRSDRKNADIQKLLFMLKKSAGNPLEHLTIFTQSRSCLEREMFMNILKMRYSRCKSVVLGRLVNGTTLTYKNGVLRNEYFPLSNYPKQMGCEMIN